MKTCENCGKQFPNFMEIDGTVRNLHRRKYCTVCSPFDEHKTRPIEDEEKFCLYCQKKLEGNQTKYCSDACKFKIHSTYPKQKDRGMERKIQLLQMAGGCCSVCGYDKNMAALSFHHLVPSTKKFQLDSRNLSNRGWDSIMSEFEKCVLLCANCHAEEHYPEMAMEILLLQFGESLVGEVESGSTRT